MDASISWTAAALAIIAAVVLPLLVQRRGRRRLERERAAQEDLRQQELTARDAALQQAEARRRAEVAELEARRDAEQAVAESYRRRAARSIGWDLLSRERIIRACERVAIDAAVATNITFTVSETGSAPFVAQVDHLVISDQAILLIESKMWAGIVFDDVLPSGVHPAFGTLIDERALKAPFTVQIKPTNGSELKTMVKSGADSPGTQVRRQARRLHSVLGQEIDALPFIQTAVFYSHPSVQVFTGASAGPSGTTESPVVCTDRQLSELIAATTRSRPGRSATGQVDAVTEVLERWGVDIHGVGAHAGRWASLPPAARAPDAGEWALPGSNR